jgi:hypothetical protein
VCAFAVAAALAILALSFAVPDAAHADASLFPNADRSPGSFFWEDWDEYDGFCDSGNSSLWSIVQADPEDLWGYWGDYEGVGCDMSIWDPQRITTATNGDTVAFELTDYGGPVTDVTIIVAAFDSLNGTSLQAEVHKADGSLIGTASPVWPLDDDIGASYYHHMTVPLTGTEVDGMYVLLRATVPSGRLNVAGVEVYVENRVLAPPTAVYDGAAADIDAQTSTTTLSANWATVTNPSFAGYEYCFTSSWNGSDCAAGALTTWTGTAATSASQGSLTLTQGTAYYACVRSVNVDTTRTAARCSDSVIPDQGVPPLPVHTWPADGSSVTQSLLAVIYSDDHTDGWSDFQVCTTAACTTIQASGTSSFTAMDDEANWLASLPAGTWYWRARSHDLAGNTTAWTTPWSFTLNNQPTVTLTTPAASAWVTSTTPTFTTSYLDPDGQAGRIRVDLCRTNPGGDWSLPAVCPSGYQTVLSASGASGVAHSTGPGTPLGQGSYYWRARGIDSGGAVGNLAAARLVRVDSLPPTDITGVTIVRSGLGKIEVSWLASSDAGSGGVTYDVEWSADGTTFTTACTNTTQLKCTKSGLGGASLPFVRIRACDQLDNCTTWDGRVGGSANGYFLRTTVASSVLTNAANRRATIASGTANTVTKQQFDTTETGWMQLQPNVASTVNPVAVEPAGTPAPATGRGWIIEETGGATLAAGSWAVTVTTESTTSSGSAKLQCRGWIVTVTGSSISASSSYQSAFSDAADVYSLGQQTHTCRLPGLATQTTLAANQYVYVELYVDATVATSSNGQQLSLWAEGTGSAISIPPPGIAPNVPTLISPSDGALVSTTPTLQAGYTHPAAQQGAIEYQVATDAGFTTVVRNATSALLSSGGTGSALLEPLPSGVTYYWRVRARDTSDLVSAWTTSRSFIVDAVPTIPTHQSPAAGGTVYVATPTLDASAFSDPDVGDTFGAAEFTIAEQSTDFAAGTDSGVLGPTDTWTTPSLAPGDWWWRVRYRDSFGAWSEWSTPTSFTVSSSSISLSLDTSTVDLGLQAPNVDRFGSVTATVSTTSAGGYSLGAVGTATGSLGMGCSGCAVPLVDWSGTSAIPSVWGGGVGGYAGMTVRDATGGRLSKWGTGTGTAENDVATNRYAGVDAATGVLLHTRATPTAGDSVVLTWRTDPTTATSAAVHTDSFVVTATALP